MTSNARWLWIVVGLVLGIYHQLMLIFAAGGAGHGHGMPLAAALWFGYGAPLWFILPPIQYAAYAYVALRRNRRLGLILALGHYAGAALLVFMQLPRGGLHDVFAVAWPSGWADAILLYGPFIGLNVVYFRRLFKEEDDGDFR